MDRLRILSNLANQNIYEYSDEDVREIFAAIESELHAARNRFEATQRRRPEFRLRAARVEAAPRNDAAPPDATPER